ncbi:MAG: hypothetical protein AAF387_18140 [Pseudomonadota bacterium]
MKQRRILILGTFIALIFLVWSLFQKSEDDILQTHQVTGVISEISQKRSPASGKPSGRQPNSIVVAVVDINDGSSVDAGKARILIRRDQFEIGDEVPLTLKLYNDGSRKVLLATPPSNERADP